MGLLGRVLRAALAEEREPVSLREAVAAARAIVASDKLHGKTTEAKVLELANLDVR